MLHIGGDFVTALDGYVQAVADVAPKARAAGIKTLHADIQRSARQHPRWGDLADHIEVWSDRRGTHLGVRNPEKLREAQAAEYGDADNPPAPVIRTAATHRARESADAVIHSYLGIPRYR